MKLAVLSRVLLEARSSQDPRWKQMIPAQLNLNRLLVEAQMEERARRGEPEPAEVIVSMRPVSCRPRTLQAGQ